VLVEKPVKAQLSLVVLYDLGRGVALD